MLFHPATSSPRRRARGSAIVLVLFMLIFMVIMGLVYLASSRNEKNAGRSGAKRDGSDDAMQATIVAIGSQISDDYVKNFLAATTNNIPYENYIVYPNAQHPWLAPVDSFKSPTYFSSGYTGPGDTWRQISSLYPGENFVKPSDPFTGLDANRQNIQVPKNSGGDWDQAMPDSNPALTVYDSRYQILHIPSADGTVWLIALHTIDNSGLINVNTATQFTNRANGDPPVAHNPSAVDLFGTIARFGSVGGGAYMANTNALSLNWNAAPTATFAGGFIQGRGFNVLNSSLADTRIGTSGAAPFGRDQLWGNALTNLHSTYVDSGGGPNSNFFYAFGPADETVLRSGSTTFNTQSSLMLAINGQGGTSTANPLLNSSPRLDNVALRRYLTTYNAVSLTPVVVGANTFYRVPMPPFLNNLDGQFAGLPSNTNPIPYFKLNPNPLSLGGDNADTIRNLMVQVFKQQGYDSINQVTYYESNIIDPSYPAAPSSLFAFQAAYWLDANLRLYTNTTNITGVDLPAADVTDVTNFPVIPNTALDGVTDPNTNTTFYPADVQPFLTEAVSIRVAGAASPTDDTMSLIVEIRNPFLGNDIDLKNYSLRVDGVDYPLSGILHGIDNLATDNMTTNVFYCYSDDTTGTGGGDSNDKTLLTSATGVGLTAAQMTNQTCVLKGFTVSTTQKLDILLVYTSPTNKDATSKPISVVVDRIRPPTSVAPAPPSWPAQAVTVPSPPAVGTISSASIQRDCGYYSYPGSSIPTVSMPNYVFENDNINVVVTNPGGASDPAGTPGITFDSTSIPNNFKFPLAAINASVTAAPLTRFIPSWKASHKLGQLPEFRILTTRGSNGVSASLNSVGDLANLLTTGHVHAGGVTPIDDPVSVNLYYRWVATPAGLQYKYQFARLRTNDFCDANANDPHIPLACLLLDAMDLLPASNTQPTISGKININTAPPPVLRALPFLGDPSVKGNGLAPNVNPSTNLAYTVPVGIQAYRDRLSDPNYAVGTPQLPNPYYDYSKNFGGGGPGALPRAFTGIVELRQFSGAPDNDLGFASAAELLCVHPADNSTLPSVAGTFDPIISTPQAAMAATGINILARDPDPLNFYYPGEKANGILNGGPANGNASPGDGTNSGPLDASQVLGDTVRANGLYNLMSNSVDVRGDVFTSYVKLVGVRQVNGVWTTVATRRFAVVFDRTGVRNAGDMPKILMLVEW